MEIKHIFKVNENIYLKDPESSELGKQIIKTSIDLIFKLGFEHFTFKKLAEEIHTTEATVYRYFINKHRLLLYILNWYWSYLEFQIHFDIHNLKDVKSKLKSILHLLTHELPESTGKLDYNKKFLNQIVISESSKVYLVKDVKEINKFEVFKPYKDLCGKIAEIISDCNPKYKFPHSLASTIMEASHHQQFFCMYLPRLTDVNATNKHDYAFLFLNDLVFKVLD